jgi:ribosome-associated protein
MSPIDISPELKFQTTRSGGKGGQHVNKVETAVIGSFSIPESAILSDDQKTILLERLSNRINAEAVLQVKSQRSRSQLGNKEDVVRKMNALVTHALKPKKKRLTTKPSRQSKEKRIKGKKIKSEIKSGRKKYRPGNE